MYEYGSPSYPPPPTRRAGLGCFTKGCLSTLTVLLLLGLLFGVLFWYVARGLAPFLSPQAALVRVYNATDEQYLAVREKVDPFIDAARAGQPATLSLSADELNTLVARDPLFDPLRGKAYFSIGKDQLCADTSFQVNQEMESMAQGPVYFRGRVIFYASYAGGDFTVVLRRLEPLGGGPMPDLAGWFIEHHDFVFGVTREINEEFHEILHQRPPLADFLSHVRRVIVKDDQIVLTAAGGPGAVAAPANPP